MSDALTQDQRRELLQIARRALVLYFEHGRTPEFESDDPTFLQPAGAFVSLHRRAPTGHQPRLRGCIGTFDGRDPLIDTVTRMAIAAATQDPRFEAVRADELPGLEIEISVLSPRRDARAEEVEVGRHGVYISHGSHRGVLLPQVAMEHGWDRETFLDHTCQKAGLPKQAWRDTETRIQIFSAEVFGEDH